MSDNGPFQLLIVEDDIEFRTTCVNWFAKRGYLVAESGDVHEALDQLSQRQFHVAIVDMNLPGLSGLELLDRIRETDIETEVIILTGVGSIETAVQAMKLGACDYLTKPFPLPELDQRCRMAYDRGRIRKENRQLRTLLSRNRRQSTMIGQSSSLRDVQRLIDRVAPTDKSVLIQGESGTGKEIAAHAIYANSPRADKPFVTVNCAALPEHLVESELFGHEKGAYTGATEQSPGLFEIADGGTLFIDEIGELAPALQPKLLRVLEDGSLRRVGSVKERQVDVRVIAATNRDLAADVAAGLFREDLFYRINVFSIELPALRQRTGDITLLIDHFLNPGWRVEAESQRVLQSYSWPGNVRQLKNALERAMILADDHVITLDDLPHEVAAETAAGVSREGTVIDLPSSDLAAIEKEHILRILAEEGGNKSRAARSLGIHRRKLYRLLERLNIQADESVQYRT